ncbi:hypothetical protein FA95DRAFT_1609677, partial [Auriscalpium vulgare]
MSTLADQDRPASSEHDGQDGQCLSATRATIPSLQPSNPAATACALKTSGQSVLHSIAGPDPVEEVATECSSDEPFQQDSVAGVSVTVVQATRADSESLSMQDNTVALNIVSEDAFQDITIHTIPLLESDKSKTIEPLQNDFSDVCPDVFTAASKTDAISTLPVTSITAPILNKLIIEEEIHFLKTQERILCEKLNRCNPTSRSHLPDEVLFRIFSFCPDIRLDVKEEDQSRDFIPEWSYSESCPHHVWHWFTVTHVCREWRRVALTKPALWSTISISWGPLWIREAVRRARPSGSLILRPGVGPFEYRLPATPRHLEVVNDVLDRVRSELRIELKSHDVSALNILAAPAPRLEKLTVVLRGGAVQAAGPILGQHAPKLSSLALDGVLFTNLNGPTWTNIVDIHLRNTGYTLGDGLRWGNLRQGHIIEALAQMPSLQIVEINDVPALDSRNMDAPSLKIGNLSRLTLTGYVYWVAVMLRSLSPDPRLVTINLGARCFDHKERTTDSDSYFIFPIISKLFVDSDVRVARLDLRMYPDDDDIDWTSTILKFKAWTEDQKLGPTFALAWEVGIYEEPPTSEAVVSILDAMPN